MAVRKLGDFFVYHHWGEMSLVLFSFSDLLIHSKKMKKTYHSREFCEITGLKPDTLRFYVDKGLIAPAVNAENQYREYTAQDVVDMFYIRKCRAMNVPIVGISDVLTRLPRDGQLLWLSEHEENLRREIAQLEWQLKRCQKMQKDIRRQPELLGHVIDQRSTEGPDLWQLDLIGPNVKDTAAAARLASMWREVWPHVLPMINVPLAELSSPACARYSVSFGIAAPEEMLQSAPELMHPPAYRYPSRDCIGMMVRLRDPFELTRSDMLPLLRYAEEHGYTLADGLTSWLVSRSIEDGQPCYCFATRVSVRHN